MVLLPLCLVAQELIDRNHLSLKWRSVQPLNHTLQDLAGDGAERCGRAPVGHDPQPWTECALKAFREKRAFYVRFDVSGFDIDSAFGVASDGSGLVYQVEDWTYWWGVPQRAPLVADQNLKLLLDSANVRTRLCPSPVRLRVTKYGALTCFATEPLAEIPQPRPTPQY
jgi:hypothetical protein